LSKNPTEDFREGRKRQLLAPAEGNGAKIPFCVTSPRSARSLSHGRVVCTYSLDTIRSTTLTRETVTATSDTAATRVDISLRRKNYYFYFAFLFCVASSYRTTSGAYVQQPSRILSRRRGVRQARAAGFLPEPGRRA